MTSELFCQNIIILNPNKHDGLSWEKLLLNLEENYDVRFYYKDDVFLNKKVEIKDSIELMQFLNNELKSYGLFISVDKHNNYFFTKSQHLKVRLPGLIVSKDIESESVEKSDLETSVNYLKTNRDFAKRTFIVGSKDKAENGKKCIVSGYVKSVENGEPIIGCAIFIKKLGIGTVSSETGFFTINVPRGTHVLTASSIEQSEKKLTIDVRSSGTLNILMKKRLVSLDEVVINADKYDNVRSTSMGLERIAMKSVKQIPQMLGETDILKVALMLPGVQNTGEASSGFNVRGSPSDQTQFFINNVPIYNTSHLFGFFSAFNPDVVEEFKLYKSNIPAEYGGRLASVFDIETTQGDDEKFSARGGISPIMGRVFLETPILKSKSSAYVGVRSTYSDWILKRVESPDIRNSSAQFYDIVSGINFDIGEKNQLELFGYYSHDDISFSTLADYKYENLGGAINWKHRLNAKSKINLSTIYSKYWLEESNHEISINSYRHKFEINNYKVIGSLDFIPNNNYKISAGFNSTLYSIHQGKHIPLADQSMVTPIDLGSETSLENALYLSSEWNIFPFLTLYGGLRFNNYNYLGAQSVYQYESNAPLEEETISDTTFYRKGEIIKSYNSLDFRIALNYMFSTSLSFKASANSLHQNLFMLSNTISISPTAKWKMADYHIKPLEGYQYTFGIYANPDATSIELSTEIYYKTVNNLVEFKNGADLTLIEIPETEIVQGELNAYGIEFMIRKKKGRLNGWLNYTYSKSEALVSSTIAENEINFGESYPTNFDKPHAFNLVANYKFNRRLNLSGNVVYNTGKPVTYPVGIYYLDGRRIINFSRRNEYRLPDYFRVDLSLNIEGNLRAQKFAHGSWSLSVYNLLGRKNAYSVYFKNEGGNIKAYKLSVFGSPIVTITYNFKFGNYAD